MKKYKLHITAAVEIRASNVSTAMNEARMFLQGMKVSSPYLSPKVMWAYIKTPSNPLVHATVVPRRKGYDE